MQIDSTVHQSSLAIQPELNFVSSLATPRFSLRETNRRTDDCASAAFSKSGLVPSVAWEAGLGGFVYLKGRSGQRYIFSAIEPHRAALYCRALFVVVESKSGSIQFVTDCNLQLGDGQVAYVHLLAEDGPSAEKIIADVENGYSEFA